MATTSPRITGISAGGGRIIVGGHGSKAIFSQLSSTYPLKLLSPYVTEARLAVVYMMTYGGGLVGGDRVDLDVQVNAGAILLLLSQGSTKVFKTRIEQRLATVYPLVAHGPKSASDAQPTIQKLDFIVSPQSALFLLPDPVTCFRSSSYTQIQTFHLSSDSSLALLDWFTSGRKSLGEEWVFSRYHSVNDILLDGKRVAKDVTLLDAEAIMAPPLSSRPLADRLNPYSCYATLILYGPIVQQVLDDLWKSYRSISVLKIPTPQDVLWSLSEIANVDRRPVTVVRVCGKETESVKEWLGEALKGLQPVVGVDIYRRAFG